MQMKMWHIKGSSFHFGRRGLGLEESSVTFSSDSLFAAMVARLAVLEGSNAVDDFVRAFKDGDPPFVLTSAYPRVGELRFFPPLALRAAEKIEESDDSSQFKKLKNVKFISEGVFRRLLDGESLKSMWQKLHKVHDGSVVMTEKERKNLPKMYQNTALKFWNVVRRPRVSVTRASSTTDIFYAGQTVFGEMCGLWFGVLWRNRDDEATVKKIFADLGVAGLGGERSAGFGACRFQEKENLELPDPDGAYWVNLSRYLPKENEMKALMAEQAAYEVQNVGGWVGTMHEKSQRRRSATLLAEGSILGALGKKVVPGQMVDVRPEYDENRRPLGHAVWRNGFSVAVGVRLAMNKEAEHDSV